MDFKEQYKHPQWQKKRLEALEDAEFICQRCYSDESQLHVHHKRYVKGRKIWEYDISELEVLCDSCHEMTHTDKEVLDSLLALIPADGIPEIISLINGYCLTVGSPCRLQTTNHHSYSSDKYAFTSGMIAGLYAGVHDTEKRLAIKDMVFDAAGRS